METKQLKLFCKPQKVSFKLQKIQMTTSKYDLEDRAFNFAADVRLFCKNLTKSLINMDDIKQVIRSSGSVGANYIEANEPLGAKDFKMRLKIARKEAKESRYWLKLIKISSEIEEVNKIEELIQEATELNKILSSIINKAKD
ncbi:four helix bundle protein [Aquimarina algiphila]|uniref:four helix bundle protein n=1 Tax=Aquimarina algiphila TaxID=2047982 RepID=UPI001FCB40C2|nr:four helix bundle protein [Aquimarina algiphila]